MAYATPQPLAQSQEALDNLFSDSPSGDIPNGEAQGTAIIASGTKYTSEIASLINIFADHLYFPFLRVTTGPANGIKQEPHN